MQGSGSEILKLKFTQKLRKSEINHLVEQRRQEVIETNKKVYFDNDRNPVVLTKNVQPLLSPFVSRT